MIEAQQTAVPCGMAQSVPNAPTEPLLEPQINYRRIGATPSLIAIAPSWIPIELTNNIPYWVQLPARAVLA